MAATGFETYLASNSDGIGLGNREDLLDLITNISPTATPFFSSVAKGTAVATTHEWLTDELKAASLGGLIEGDEAAYISLTPRARLSNFTQIWNNAYEVSRTQDMVSKAGVSSEVAYQATKAMKEHVRDIEFSIFANTVAGAVGDGTAVARSIKSIGAFITRNKDVNVLAGVLEDDINDQLALVWNDGGEPDTVFCSSGIKKQFSDFTADVNRTANINVDGSSDRKLVISIDIYESDFGVLQLIPDRFVGDVGGTSGGRGGTALGSIMHCVEMSKWRFDFLMNPKTEELAKTGDAQRHWIISEGTLVGLAPKSGFELIDVLDVV